MRLLAPPYMRLSVRPLFAKELRRLIVRGPFLVPSPSAYYVVCACVGVLTRSPTTCTKIFRSPPIHCVRARALKGSSRMVVHVHTHAPPFLFPSACFSNPAPSPPPLPPLPNSCWGRIVWRVCVQLPLTTLSHHYQGPFLASPHLPSRPLTEAPGSVHHGYQRRKFKQPRSDAFWLGGRNHFQILFIIPPPSFPLRVPLLSSLASNPNTAALIPITRLHPNPPNPVSDLTVPLFTSGLFLVKEIENFPLGRGYSGCTSFRLYILLPISSMFLATSSCLSRYLCRDPVYMVPLSHFP